MRTWVRLSSAVAIAATTMATAGCATAGSANTAAGAKDPKGAITASFAKLYDHRSVSFSIHLKDDSGNLLKAMTSGAHALPGIYAKRIIGGEIRLTQSAPSGKTLSATRHEGTGSQDNFSLAVLDEGTPLFDVVLVSGDLYLRLGVAKLRDLAGGAINRIVTGIGQFSPALAAGDYVKIPQIGKTVRDLASQHGGGIVPKPASSAQASKFLTDIVAAFQNVVTYTSKGSGQYGFALDVKGAASAFVSVFSANSGLLGPAAAGLGKVQTELAKVPAGEVTGDVNTKDGAFSSMSLDLDSIVALARKASPSSKAPSLSGAFLAIDATSSSDGVSAPATSTPLDISQLLGGFLGGIKSSTFSSTQTSIVTSSGG